MQTKKCTKCSEEKSLDEFYNSKRAKDGKDSWCKTCQNIKARNYNLKHQDNIKNYRKLWYKEHKEECQIYRKKYKPKYYLKNKKQIDDKARDYCRKFPWKIVFNSIKQRCNNLKCKDYKNYGGRGIKCLIAVDEVKMLWFRDKAWELNQPSIDRKDNDGNYTYDNCQFIEMIDNVAKQDKKAVIQKLSKPVEQYDLDGNFIRSWKGIAEVQRCFKQNLTHISGVCNGKRKTAYGFIWKFKNKVT